MTNEEGGFCVGCGCQLPADATFCPECGQSVDGRDNPYQHSGQVQTAVDDLNKLQMWILVYAVIAALAGALFLVMGSALNQELWDTMLELIDPSMVGAYEELGMDAFKNSLYLLGGTLFCSGIFAGVSGYLTGKHRNWIVAFVTCIAASVLSLGFGVFGVITLVIGLYMAFRIYKGKNAFDS